MKNGTYHVAYTRAIYSKSGQLGIDAPVHDGEPVAAIRYFSPPSKRGRYDTADVHGPDAERDLALSLIAHVGNFDPEALQIQLNRRERMGLMPVHQEVYDLSGHLGKRLGNELARGVSVFKLDAIRAWIREARGIVQAERSGLGCSHASE